MEYSLKIEDCLETVQLSMDGWLEDRKLSEDSTAKYGIFVEDRRLSKDSTAKYGRLDSR